MPRAQRSNSHRPREAREKKQIYERKKSMRGVPDNPYQELKKTVTLSLTPTAVTGLDQLSRAQNLSRSELIERLGRGRLRLQESTPVDWSYLLLS